MLQQCHIAPITTTVCGWPVKCPKRVLESCLQNPLIFQAKQRVDMLAEKAYLTGYAEQGQPVMRTALYLRISISQHKPDLQRDDLHSYAERMGLARLWPCLIFEKVRADNVS